MGGAFANLVPPCRGLQWHSKHCLALEVEVAISSPNAFLSEGKPLGTPLRRNTNGYPYLPKIRIIRIMTNLSIHSRTYSNLPAIFWAEIFFYKL